MRSPLLAVTLIAGPSALGCSRPPQLPAPVSTRSMTIPDVTPRALRVYRDAFVIDMHNDLASRILDDGYDPDVRHTPGFGPREGHTDLPRLVEFVRAHPEIGSAAMV